MPFYLVLLQQLPHTDQNPTSRAVGLRIETFKAIPVCRYSAREKGIYSFETRKADLSEAQGKSPLIKNIKI
jgi:hypothetical protein